ncbi:MAG: SAVED domain-containing protein [Dehalococcoidia bacterium]|nr:SAVED domain-containing protein [Dehalococcoidia bacterium]
MTALVALISYQARDLPSAELLHEEMSMRGLSVIRDRVAFLDGRRIEFEMSEAVERCDALVAYLTPNSLYLDQQPGRPRPALDFEFQPAMQRRRKHIAELRSLGNDDTSAIRPVVIPVLFGLGDPRTDGVEAVRQATGENIGSLWLPSISPGGQGILSEDAATIAHGTLAALLPARHGGSVLTKPIELQIATRGTPSASRGLCIDATALMGGDARRPGEPRDWTRFLRGLADVGQVLKAHSPERRILITPQTHLSGAIAIGRVFHQASGWQLQVVGRHGTARPGNTADTADLRMSWDPEDPGAREMSVEIDLIGHPVYEIARDLLRSLSTSVRGRLQVSWQGANDLTPDQTSAIADSVAREIRARVTATRPRVVHVMCATPADFATLLGHRLTALEVDLQLYERSGDSYVPSLLIPANLP